MILALTITQVLDLSCSRDLQFLRLFVKNDICTANRLKELLVE
jgi:hypothetical protein